MSALRDLLNSNRPLILSAAMMLGILVPLTSYSSDLNVKSPGLAPGRELKIKKSGVPTYNMISFKGSKKKEVPKLNVGEEAQFEAADLKVQGTVETPKTLQLAPFQPSPSPKIVEIKNYLKPQFSPPPMAKDLVKIDPTFKPPEVKGLKEVADPTLAESEPKETKIATLSTPEEKLLQGIILLDYQKSYVLSFGLIAEVLGESKELKTEATYHFARAALAVGLIAEHKFYMTKLLKEAPKDWQKRAALSLAMDAHEGELDTVPVLDPKIDELNIDLIGADQYQINRSRYYIAKSDLSNAMAAAEEVKDNSPLISEARFMRSLILYRSGKLDDAEKMMSSVVMSLEKQAPDSELKSVTALTLARLQFQKGQYKDAFQSYLLVSKNNPLWMQAMVEQAWAQILTEDYEGAAGNMYTLHTDFFKNAFAPESYVARAVGYLNLCQFGDGAKVVYSLNRRYQPMKDMLEQFKEKSKTNAAYYDSVKTFFKNPQLKIIDGLHRNFIYEIARNPQFMEQQKLVNSVEDQISKYNNISLEILQLERTLLQKQSETEGTIASLQKPSVKNTEKVDHSAEIAQLKAQLANYKIQYQIAKGARNSMKDVRTPGLVRLEADKVEYRNRAAHALKIRFDEMLASLNKSLDQAEVLHYELYSGAGEHLRFQMGGGELNDKEREALKVQDNKSLKWDFKGEVWEDELGHYRSSLKNVCPKEDGKTTKN